MPFTLEDFGVSGLGAATLTPLAALTARLAELQSLPPKGRAPDHFARLAVLFREIEAERIREAAARVTDARRAFEQREAENARAHAQAGQEAARVRAAGGEGDMDEDGDDDLEGLGGLAALAGIGDLGKGGILKRATKLATSPLTAARKAVKSIARPVTRIAKKPKSRPRPQAAPPPRPRPMPVPPAPVFAEETPLDMGPLVAPTPAPAFTPQAPQAPQPRFQFQPPVAASQPFPGGGGGGDDDQGAFFQPEAETASPFEAEDSGPGPDASEEPVDPEFMDVDPEGFEGLGALAFPIPLVAGGGFFAARKGVFGKAAQSLTGGRKKKRRPRPSGLSEEQIEAERARVVEGARGAQEGASAARAAAQGLDAAGRARVAPLVNVALRAQAAAIRAVNAAARTTDGGALARLVASAHNAAGQAQRAAEQVEAVAGELAEEQAAPPEPEPETEPETPDDDLEGLGEAMEFPPGFSVRPMEPWERSNAGLDPGLGFLPAAAIPALTSAGGGLLRKFTKAPRAKDKDRKPAPSSASASLSPSASGGGGGFSWWVPLAVAVGAVLVVGTGGLIFFLAAGARRGRRA